MTPPSETQLMLMPSVTDFGDAAEHLARVIRDAVTFGRAGTVTIKLKAAFDKEDGKFKVTRTVTSKRPVDDDRNEEVIGSETCVFVMSQDIPGQMRLDGSVADAAGRFASSLPEDTQVVIKRRKADEA